jgi:hypothetical protein
MLTRYEDYAGNITGPLQEYPQSNWPSFPSAYSMALTPSTTAKNSINAKDTPKGATTTAMYFADLNKPMTEFFKTKILGDKENHRMCGKAGSLSLFN